jgi:hypothetical protein
MSLSVELSAGDIENGVRVRPVDSATEAWAGDRSVEAIFGAEIEEGAYRTLVLINTHPSDDSRYKSFQNESPLDIMPCELTARCEVLNELGGLREEMVFEAAVVPRARVVYYCLGNGRASSESCRMPSLWAQMGECTVQITEFASFDLGSVVERDRVDDFDTGHFLRSVEALLDDRIAEALSTICLYPPRQIGTSSP